MLVPSFMLLSITFKQIGVYLNKVPPPPSIWINMYYLNLKDIKNIHVTRSGPDSPGGSKIRKSTLKKLVLLIK